MLLKTATFDKEEIINIIYLVYIKSFVCLICYAQIERGLCACVCVHVHVYVCALCVCVHVCVCTYMEIKSRSVRDDDIKGKGNG